MSYFKAEYRDVNPNTRARISTASGTDFQGMSPQEYKTAKEAIKDAITAEESGQFTKVSVFLEGFGVIEMNQARDLYTYWQENSML